MNTSAHTHMMGKVLILLLMLSTGFSVKAQQVEVAELDDKITQLNVEEGEELRGLYYDSKASVLYRSDKSEPIQVGKGRTRVIYLDITRIGVLSDLDGPFVSMVIVDFTNKGSDGSYSISAHDLANFPLLKFVVFVANDNASAKQLATNSIKDLPGNQPYSILYKSLTPAN